MRKFFVKSILISLLTTGIWFYIPYQPVYSAPSSLTQKLHQTNKKRSYFHEKSKQADLKLKKEKNKLSTNQQKLEKAHAQLRNTTLKYNNLVSSLVSMEAQLAAAQRDFSSIDVDLKQRIRGAFKHQRYGMFMLILASRDVNSLLDTFYYEKIIIKLNYEKLKVAKAKAAQLIQMKARIESQKRSVAASLKDINSQRAYIQNSIAANKTMIERLKKDKRYYEQSERELARQSENIQNMIAGINKKGGKNTIISASGRFIKPIAGPITSPFGYRIHPIFKSRIFHSGIDIGGPNNGPIKASNSGKVIYSGWYGGYGRVVIIDHGIVNGKPITTLYAHMSSIAVSNGQNVKQGQTVGREGSTGYSTGPHCHFEVRVNGKPTNPLNYI